MKEFFENPALLFGAPLVVIGLVGGGAMLAGLVISWLRPSGGGR